VNGVPQLSWPYSALRLMLVDPVQTEVGLPFLLSTMNLLCISFALVRGKQYSIFASAIACVLVFRCRHPIRDR
jgi:hypothetical protein